ncbi:MAG: DUF4255 domain-containing protein [Cyanobacteria bacterium SID2]|nr:DUF4255 domain-containing protein [Cyanobacteria bacterium SID2]MBP0003736.1 DUF4255 domain-containing protein [Cyanobacteria bacterium SBC]
MSNYLAIATVTAVLQQLLQEGVEADVPGAQVTTVRPDKKQGPDLDKPGINIYLYQVTPNPAWRNADLRTRRPKGDLGKQRQAGLDLQYLFTFYGDERELIPQRLLGSAVRTLVDRPVLDLETLQRFTNRSRTSPSNHSYLSESTLAEQVQRVKLMPSLITTEDLSRIWSVFFQTPYSLSLAYQGTAVLIEGDLAGQKSLPLRRPPSVSIAPQRPMLESVSFQEGNSPPTVLEQLANQIVASGTLIVRGKQLVGDRTQLQIGNALLTPQFTNETELQLDLGRLPYPEADQLRAGIAGLKVVRWQSRGARDPEGRIESNAVPLVLCPRITETMLSCDDLEEDDYEKYSGRLVVPLDLPVDDRQQVFVLLNGIDTSQAYVFSRQRGEALTHTPSFFLEGVEPGEYLVRVQVDGAESRLNVNPETDRYDSPKVIMQ